MNRLNKITYFNNDPFSFGEIDVSGNTLLTGTNGVGKSTAMRSVLFFYGVSKSASGLGIKKSQGNKVWREYFYPSENSYTFYQYTGLHHEVLLMTYRVKNTIQYRFIKLDDKDELSLKDIVLSGNTALLPKELLSVFSERGYKVSESISKAETYKTILYGNVDANHRSSFKNYALMKTKGDYNLIAKVLPEIFLNSSIDSGTIESTIANSFESDSDISLVQIHSQILDTMKQYNTIVAFDNEASSRKKVEKELNNIMSERSGLFSLVSQFMKSYKHYKDSLPEIQSKLETENESFSQLCALGKESSAERNIKRDEALSSDNVLKSQLETALETQGKYKDKDMPDLISKVESIEGIVNNIKNITLQLETITGEQGEITKKFSKQRDEIRDDIISRKEKRLIEEDSAKESSEEQVVSINEDFKETISSLKGKLKEEYSRLSKSLSDERSKNKQLTESNIRLSIKQFNEELLEQTQFLENNSAEIQNINHSIELNKSSINTGIKSRELVERDIQKINDDSNGIYEAFKDKIDEQILVQRKLLAPDEQSLLAFIRRQSSDNDSIITSLTKDSVLLQCDLEPMQSEVNGGDFFGIKLQTENLESSNYSIDSINEKVSALTKTRELKKEKEEERIVPLLKELVRKEKAKSQEIQQLNSSRNVLDSKLLSLEALNIELTDRCTQLQISSQEEFQKAVEKSNSELQDSAKSLALAEQLLNQFNEKQESEIQKIEQNKESALEVIRDAARERNAKYNTFKSDIEKELSDTLGNIDTLENEALSSEGVDEKKIEALKESISKLKIALREAKELEITVNEYKYDKDTIDSIPLRESNSSEATKEFNKLNNLCVSENNKQSAKEKKAQSSINALIEKIGNVEFQLNGMDERIEDYAIEREEFDIKQNGIQISDNLHKLVNSIAISQRVIEKNVGTLNELIQRIESKLGEYYIDSSKAIFRFHRGYREAEVLDAARDMVSFASDGRFSDAKILVARQIKMVYGIVSEHYTELIKESDKVSLLVSKINRQLKSAIENIEIIRNIEMRYTPTLDPVLSSLQEITSIELPIGTHGTLFSRDNGEKAYSQILKAFDSLIDHLSRDKRDKIGIVDTFQVDFRVDERGKDSGWVRSRETIGSTGTTIIVKSLTYIALLDTVLTMAKRDDDSMIHVLLDEIGTLAQGNMRKIVEYANERNILFLNAAPDSKIPDKFKNIYYFKLIGRKSKVLRVAKRV